MNCFWCNTEIPEENAKEVETETCAKCSRASEQENKEALDDKTSREVKMEKRAEDLRCSFCPPNGGENKKNWARRGVQKPKYKNRP